MFLALLSGLALAGDVDLSPAAVWAPRPFDGDRGGAALAITWQPERVGLSLTAEQRIPRARDRYAITDQIIDDEVFLGDASPILRRASLVLDMVAVTGTIHAGRRELPLRLHLGAGAGLVETVDDLEALDRETDPESIATERQVHPTLDLAAALDVGLSERVLLRAALANVRYVETIEGTEIFARSSVAWSLGPTIAL